MITFSDILKLTKQLLPSGRAWRLPESGYFKKLIYALGKSEQRAYEFALSTLYRVLPDNENFTVDDATEWERRLNISGGTGYVPLEIRKATILRKYQFPGSFLNRQNYLYVEAQLQLAGYDVTVTENYDDFTTPTAILHSLTTLHSLNTLHGGAILFDDIIANSADKGEVFLIDTYKGVFYIDGEIPANSIKAFRILVLSLKPANTVAILRLTYTNVVELIYTTGDPIYTTDDRQLIAV